LFYYFHYYYFCLVYFLSWSKSNVQQQYSQFQLIRSSVNTDPKSKIMNALQLPLIYFQTQNLWNQYKQREKNGNRGKRKKKSSEPKFISHAENQIFTSNHKSSKYQYQLTEKKRTRPISIPIYTNLKHSSSHKQPKIQNRIKHKRNRRTTISKKPITQGAKKWQQQKKQEKVSKP
jgi:hypothetical protein